MIVWFSKKLFTFKIGIKKAHLQGKWPWFNTQSFDTHFSEYQEYKICRIPAIYLYYETNLMLNMTLETVPTSFQSEHFDDIVNIAMVPL